MKKKVHQVGVIKDSELKKKVRKPLPPPDYPFKSKKAYKRKNKIENE